MKKKICICSTLVFPPHVENNLRNNLLSQLSMMLTFLSHYQNEVHTVLVSNDIKTVSNLIIKKGFQFENFDVLEIKNEELYFCNEADWGFTKYHFSKLDSLKLLNNYLKEKKTFNKLVISDIDCIFLDIKKIINLSKNIKTMAAINYRSEKKTNYKFDEMICNAIREYWPDFYSNKDMAWINSGFLILDIKLIPIILDSSKSIFDWLNKNMKLVKNVSDNHFGDETLFSAIFNKLEGFEIDNKKSKVARFFWTCQTKRITNTTPMILNLIYYPSHIHLPAIKYSETKYQMALLTKIGLFKKLNFLIIILLNFWRSKARLHNTLTNSFIYKIYKFYKNFFHH